MAAGDIASGMARGLTADAVGYPVDVATQLLNLGLAGYGYVGNKLGLLKPEQMPALVQNPIGGSDWFAKNTPLEDNGTAAYSAGRMTGNILPLLVGLAGKAPAPVAGQVNALYPGGLRNDLIVSHGTSEKGLIGPNGKLVSELYHPSFAVTSEKLSPFASDIALIPHEGAFNPRETGSVLTATDYYTPRHNDAAGMRFDNIPDGASFADIAAARLADRFNTQFPRGGFYAEGTGPWSLTKGLARYMQSDPERNLAFANRPMPTPLSSARKIREAASPRFQSLESFENSPYGGQLLQGNVDPSAFTDELSFRTGKLIHPLYLAAEDGDFPNLAYPYDTRSNYQALLQLASGKASPREISLGIPRSKQAAIREDFDYSALRKLREDGTSLDSTYQPLSSDEIQQLIAESRDILKGYKTTPSEYAELKQYGPVGLHSGNFAGAVINRDVDPSIAVQLERRGISVDRTNSYGNLYADPDSFSRAQELQQDAKRIPLLSGGLANSRFSAKPPVAPSGVTGNSWMDKMMSYNSFKNGDWDYIPDSNYKQLQQYFAKTPGTSELADALTLYKNANMTGDGAAHDAALGEFLKLWDAHKALVAP